MTSQLLVTPISRENNIILLGETKAVFQLDILIHVLKKIEHYFFQTKVITLLTYVDSDDNFCAIRKGTCLAVFSYCKD
ncbi:MAG: hypothetical protein A3F10_01560 [Coxiella sp. RIFCSPHIGHO2_12_FULL_42_15]|nr:MAG: hypothetical protein A3F10_01560 [Coxiella sp. RIFCSPHIGHO2_12_FULL_42_15]